MKEFTILSHLKRIVFVFILSGLTFHHNSYAQSAIQTQLGNNIKYVVAKDGSGNYATVQAAINAIPNNSTSSQVIFIKKGTYTEKVEIPSTKTHLVLIGEDVNTTIIAYGDYSGSGKIYNGIISFAKGLAIGTSTSHTLYAAAADFTMMNITVKNTAGDVGQAVAINSNADRQFYYHCKITGHQDTYYTWASARYYLKDCYIEGAVDFIFGSGAALFDSCQLNAIRNGISYTAASTDQNFKFGYVFNNCKLTANSGVTGIFLGRPWKPYCQVVFMNSEEPAALNSAGWSKWSGNTNDQTCYYAEYKDCGSGSSTSKRASWTHQLTAAQAATYTRTNIFDKNVNPKPFAASWDPNPEGNMFYNIVNKNTNPFITSTCVPAVVTCSSTIYSSTTNLCTTGSIVLTASSGSSYKWFNGTTQVGTAATYTAITPGAYTVEVTNSSGCKATSAARTLTGTPQATPTIMSSTTNLCTTGSIELTVTSGSSYKWFNGTTQVGTAATYTATDSGDYSVEVTNSSGCKATSATRTLTRTPQATPVITSSSTSFCTGGSTVLTASAGTSYKWFDGATEVGTAVTYPATTAGAYTVEVTNASGCKATSAATQITVTASIAWYADVDNDGVGDVANTVSSCTKPNGYVSLAGDGCPTDPAKIAAGNCGCEKTEASCLDCAGTPNGTATLDNCNICVGGTTGNRACVTTATVNDTNANIKVIPQPFDANTHISIDNLGLIQSFTIINSSGAVVDKRQGLHREEIAVGENLTSGLYTVIITTEEGIYTTKIVKK